MVDICSMAASSHPSHQERETKGEATSCSSAGRSRRVGGRITAVVGVAAPQHQCSASTVLTLPLAVATEGTLVAAHQLLNSPPPPHTSLSVVEQWHHDIDQLIIATINMPPQRGRQPPLQ
jgi:hypothetical protein